MLFTKSADYFFGSHNLLGIFTGLRLRISDNFGSLPPSNASLLADSRAIKAFKASRNRADFSLSPVNFWAFFINSSSNVIVVRIVFKLAANPWCHLACLPGLCP